MEGIELSIEKISEIFGEQLRSLPIKGAGKHERGNLFKKI